MVWARYFRYTVTTRLFMTQWVQLVVPDPTSVRPGPTSVRFFFMAYELVEGPRFLRWTLASPSGGPVGPAGRPWTHQHKVFLQNLGPKSYQR